MLIRTVGVEVSGHSNLNTEESWAVWARDGSSSRRLGFVFSGLPVLLCCIRHVGFTSLVAVMDPLFSRVSTSQESGLIVKVGLLAILKKNILHFAGTFSFCSLSNGSFLGTRWSGIRKACRAQWSCNSRGIVQFMTTPQAFNTYFMALFVLGTSNFLS